MGLLVVEDRDRHVLRDPVAAVGDLDDAVVVLDRAGLRLDHAADHVHDVGLVRGRLEIGLLGAELQRAGHDPVELLDPLGEPLRMAELLLDVLLERLDDLLRAHAIWIDGVRDVAHDGLELTPVRLREQLDDLLTLLGVLVGEDSLRARADGHRGVASMVRVTAYGQSSYTREVEGTAHAATSEAPEGGDAAMRA